MVLSSREVDEVAVLGKLRDVRNRVGRNRLRRDVPQDRHALKPGILVAEQGAREASMTAISQATDESDRCDDEPRAPWDERDLTFEEDVLLDTLTVEHQERMRSLAAELAGAAERS